MSEGETVAVDQPLVSMETAKALVDVPAPYAGDIKTLHGNIGDTIDTGQPLVTFSGTNNALTDKTENDAGTVVGDIKSSDQVIASAKASMTTARPTISNTDNTQLATPRVRVLAQELGVDLGSLTISCTHITTADVKKAANLNQKQQAKTHEKFPGTAIPLTPVRKAMLMSMQRSLTEVAPVTLADDANIHNWFGKKDVTVTILNALVSACQAEPTMNAFFFGTGEKHLSADNH